MLLPFTLHLYNGCYSSIYSVYYNYIHLIDVCLPPALTLVNKMLYPYLSAIHKKMRYECVGNVGIMLLYMDSSQQTACM